MNYYNDFDPFVCEWLRNLIREGLIPKGDVDERPIQQVQPSDLVGYTQCHWFCGIAGWPLALQLAGWPDDRPVWSGSCPCQSYSAAGKHRGNDDERNLWPHFFRLIKKCKPPVVFMEQVDGAIRHGWLDGVIRDMEGESYAIGRGVLQASAKNAPHRRNRLWIVADAEWDEQPREKPCRGAIGRVGRVQQLLSWDAGWPAALARFRVMDDGIPRCVEATDAARNAIVPQVAAEFIRAYMSCAPTAT